MRMHYLAAIGALILLVVCLSPAEAAGRGGGGGGRAMGGGGGGGGRASFGGGGRPGGGARPSMSRPSASRPSASRPSASRPSMAGASRPGNVSRPSVSTRPSPSRPSGSMGGLHPSGGRPSINPDISRPSTPQISRPGAGSSGIANRPSVRPPGDLKPATRPSLPGSGGSGIWNPDVAMRPSLPGGSNRPSIGNIDRPTTRPGQGGGGIQRPGDITRPGNLPGIGDIARPGQGGGTQLPGIGDITRPGQLPSTRPGQGGSGIWNPDRPVIGGGTRPGQGGGGVQRPNRPGGPDRPWNPDRPDRPIIGGGDDHIHIGDNNVNFNNWGLQRPGGDYWSQHHDWADHWHDHHIHDHYHDWYHGCWGGHWGNNWYAPIVWSGVGWGLGYATASSWGYGPSYYNPYYDAAAAAPIYDYSQPVYVTSYAEPDGYSTAATTAAPANTPPPQPQEPPENQRAMQLFDAGMAAFKAGDYSQALASYDDALKLMPSDPVLHEVRALSLFALGRYKDSAATLNALLASSPGMDWTSMSSLYGSVDDYTSQLRKLETYVKGHPDDPSAIFVLAYHYLVTGHNDSAVRALQAVVKLQPKDTTAQRMLAALAPPEEAPAETPPTPEATTPIPGESPQTDLVGKWLAKGEGVTIELGIDEKSQFTWKATPSGKAPVELSGEVATTSDSLVLETKDQGAMAGQVKSDGPDKFTFAMAGMPPNDPGLTFERVKTP